MYGCDKVSLFACLTITATQDGIMYTRQREIARGDIHIKSSEMQYRVWRGGTHFELCEQS